MRHAAIAVFLMTFVPVALLAQAAAQPAFEVASVKPNRSGDASMSFRASAGSDEFRATNSTVRSLIRQAFQVSQASELSGGPSWLDTDRFDIVAKANSPAVPKLPMVRALLAERFKLITHRETMTLPIYALVVVKRDQRLQSSSAECTARPSPCRIQLGPGVLAGRGVPMALLVSTLSGAAQRRVVDRTDIQGPVDIDLHWSADGPARGDTSPTDSPSIFTAVQEQLGLKLESTRGPVEVLVIDHVERPTED